MERWSSVVSEGGSSRVARRMGAGRDLLPLHRAHPERYPHLLESAASGPHGRFDILFALPGASLTLWPDGRLDGALSVPGRDFLSHFDAQVARTACSALEATAHLPFAGGWFFYLGYELAAQIEPVLDLPRHDAEWPVAFATHFSAAVIRDHVENALWIAAEHAEALAQVAADLAGLVMDEGEPLPPLPALELAEDDPLRYMQGVERIRAYIREGDVFQANLSRAWQGRFATPVAAADLYARLRRANPAPFAALVSHGDAAVVSSSPERLVKVAQGVVETRPIAGTRPRGGDDEADRALMAELIAHPKERAEHVMLIDLERNDLGRICQPGSVEVNELMVIESYAHVHHIVSNVRGCLRAGVGAADVLRAVFPGGTITGCPKVRCMQILAELEQVGRGPYTGSVGYVRDDGGGMDSNILIRTLRLQADGVLSLRTGAGIVADSQPERELEETRAKARGLLRALGKT